MVEGSPIRAYVLKMIGYVEKLERLGFPFSQDLVIDLVLQSLPQSYGQFVINYNMNEIDKPLLELLSMLRIFEQNLQKTKPKTIIMVQKGKGKGKCKKKKDSKSKGKPKPTNATLKPKGGVVKEGKCFHCGDIKHWKRNCKIYLKVLKKKKQSETSTASCIFIIKVNLSTFTS